ncbi:MAG: phosphomannomutase/phosphoglucomutase [Actinomycetota bacterium]
MKPLGPIFKAYDIRGIHPGDLDEEVARRVGSAFTEFTGASRVVMARDCRLSSPSLSAAFAEGVTARGVDVVDIDLATTDMLYFASGRLDIPGVMFTASHNPPEWNGMKLCRAGAAPVGEDSGLMEVRDMAEREPPPPVASPGRVTQQQMLDEYLDHVLTFVNAEAIAPLTVVADAANGMAGLVLPHIAERLPIKLVGLYMDLDGTFPNHPADPIQPENQADLRKAVLEHGADLGLAFDGDADRVFVVDERAEGVSGSLITALVAEAMLEREPGAKVLHNVICSWVVPEVVREHGGEPIRTRVGHSLIKKVMAETGAIFGGEHSGHYYFRDHYRADSGLIAALIVLERLSQSGSMMSELLTPYQRYHASGELNSTVEDPEWTIERVARAYGDGRQDKLDGLTVEYDDWWFNVRPSNTEPLLRLNIEARTEQLLELKTRELLALIREG